MRVWIDCEFNEFRGALISLALVSEDGREWYGVLACPNPGEWVEQHVMPVLGRAPMDREEFTSSLQRWLIQFDTVHVIADWPEDISHFCQALIIAPGTRITTPALSMEVRGDLDEVPSAVPHNALWDARALKASHLVIEKGATKRDKRKSQ